MGWIGMIRVDGQPFQWLGNFPNYNFTNTVASTITPTKTIFTIQAGHMKFNATFFTPIEVYPFHDSLWHCVDALHSQTTILVNQSHSRIYPLMDSLRMMGCHIPYNCILTLPVVSVAFGK
jgi:hypothetical protein